MPSAYLLDMEHTNLLAVFLTFFSIRTNDQIFLLILEASKVNKISDFIMSSTDYVHLRWNVHKNSVSNSSNTETLQSKTLRIIGEKIVQLSASQTEVRQL